MRNAECGTRNDFAPLKLRKQGKNDKCGTRSAEYGTTLFECRMQNAERSAKHSAKFALICKLNWLSPAKFPSGAKFAYRELMVANLI